MPRREPLLGSFSLGGEQAGMLQPTLPAPASGLYELHLGPDSFSPRTPPAPAGRSPLQILPPCCSMVGSSGGSSSCANGDMGWRREWEWEGEGAAPAPSTVFSFSGTDAKRGWAASSASCLVSGGRPRNSRLRLTAESSVLCVRVAGGSGVR